MKLIRNVSLPSGTNLKTVNILFDEVIEQISPNPISAENITEEFDFKGLIVLPGAVDIHTHLLRGNADDNKNLPKATLAALKGGYTTLGDIAYAAEKPIFRASDLEFYRQIIEARSHCDIALWGHIDYAQFPYHIDHINEIWSAGAVGLTIMNPSPNSLVETLSYNDVMDLFDAIYDTDIAFAFQGFDFEAASASEAVLSVFLEKRLSAIKKILRRLQDNPLHLIGTWDKETLDVLNVAYRRADLTYAFPIQKLFEHINKFNQDSSRSDPAFLEYARLLFDTMKNGKLYTLSTEADFSIRNQEDINSLAFTGYDSKWLQWAVPWTLSELWKKNRASLPSCIRMLSENPAKRLGLHPYKGTLGKGACADMIIIDPHTPVLSGLSDAEGNSVTLPVSIHATFSHGSKVMPSDKSCKLKGSLIKRSGTSRRRSSSSW
jgi:hypothetical protein